ncbi:MAG: hypothetical protein WC420_00010 [Candidatus Paceibacterota bacterium]|jgi:hypothetical protein
MNKEINYSGAAAGSIAVFFVTALLTFIIGSFISSSLETIGLITIFFSWTIMLIVQFILCKEISFKAIEPLILFGLIGPLWALLGAILILFGVLK